MMKRALRFLAPAALLWASAAHAAKITLDPPPDVPAGLSAGEIAELTAKRDALVTQFKAVQGQIDSQAEDCHAVARASPKADECRARGAEVVSSVQHYRAALAGFLVAEENARKKEQAAVVVLQKAAVDCAAADVIRVAGEMGPEGKTLAAEFVQQVNEAKERLASEPPSGKGDLKVLTVSLDKRVKGPKGEGQMIVTASILRDEATGELHVDFQHSLLQGTRKSDEGLSLFHLDPSGRLKASSFEVSPSVEKCLVKLQEVP